MAGDEPSHVALVAGGHGRQVSVEAEQGGGEPAQVVPGVPGIRGI